LHLEAEEGKLNITGITYRLFRYSQENRLFKLQSEVNPIYNYQICLKIIQ